MFTNIPFIFAGSKIMQLCKYFKSVVKNLSHPKSFLFAIGDWATDKSHPDNNQLFGNELALFCD